ncbi:protein required for normal CLN1 and CLN2 G1 cyclin expression [Sorochytrium milnesiophthora]
MSAVIEISLNSGDVLELDPEDLPENIQETMGLLRDERCDLRAWLTVGVAYYKKGRVNDFLTIMQNALTYAKADLQRTQQAALCAIASCYTTKYYSVSSASERAKFLDSANAPISQAEKVNFSTPVVWISKGLVFLSRNNYDQAKLNFEVYISSVPHSLPANMGLACAYMGKGDWLAALKSWQLCLRILAGNTKAPLDVQCMVRCGIGLCFDKLECPNSARTAFERVLDMDPKNPTALVLLSTISLNAMKHPATSESDRREFLAMGVGYATKAFQEMKARDESNPVVLARIADILFLQKHHVKSLKAASKAGEFTTSATLLAEVHYCLGRGYHVEGKFTEAMTAYSKSLSYKSDYLLSRYAQGQMYLQRNETTKAIECFEYVRDRVRDMKKNDSRAAHLSRSSLSGSTAGNPDEDYDTLKKLGFLYAQLAEAPIEATASTPTKEYEQKREQSRQLYNKALDTFRTLFQFRSADESEMGSLDPQVLIVYGRMLERSPSSPAESKNQALQLYLTAQKALADKGLAGTRPELTNNIGVLYHNLNDLERAKAYYYTALTEAKALDAGKASTEVKDTLETTIMYNTARLFEDLQSDAEAEKFHRAVLARHSFYFDSQIRLGVISQSRGQLQEAADHYQMVLDQDPKNVEAHCQLGALQLTQNQTRAAKKNFERVLQSIDKFDVTSLLQLANLYLFGSVGKEKSEEKSKNLSEAWKVFDKVLQLDPRNPVAANGIAIALREKGWTEEALLLFEQVRESDANVPYFTINYAHMLTEMQQYQRAIRLYEKASEKFFENRNPEVLVAVARAYYLFGKSSKSPEYLRSAMRCLQKALHIFPKDRTQLFNLAVVQQDLTVTITGERIDKVSVDEMRDALKHATMAIRTFNNLSQIKSEQYDHSIASQRASYTATVRDKLVKRIDEAIQTEEDREKRLEDMRQELLRTAQDAEAKERQREEEKRREQERIARDYEELNEKVKSNLRAWDEYQVTEAKRRRRKDEDGFVLRDDEDGASESDEGAPGDGTPKRKRDGDGSGKKEKKRKLVRKNTDDGEHDNGNEYGVGSSSASSGSRKKRAAAVDDYIADSDEELRDG